MRRTNVLALVFSVLALAAAVWVVWVQTATTTDKEAVQQQAKSLADQVTEACEKGGPVAAQLGAACQKAAEVQDSPAPTAPASMVDPAVVREAARSAVLDYCGQPSQPCRGKDGASPDIDGIVARVVAKIPIPKDGTDGAKGMDGNDAPPVTDDQLSAQVAAYCAQTDEPCRGPAGTNGANGTNGVDGAPGPACPDGYELRDAVITAPDGSTYQGKACVDPSTSQPPSEPPTTEPTETPGG